MARFWDDATYEPRPRRVEPEPACFDCGTNDFMDPQIKRVVRYSVPGRTFCSSCYCWRQKRLAEFDVRRRQQLEAIDEHAEAFARR